ncbi:MAG: 4-hydroxy-3-methylbut-2-enyl diphosphate reductase [Rugosibacter sp.]|nr:4-hydroxy-3-methylbut-2-enyl diphosphate reductase [Rugosibacter sp.]
MQTILLANPRGFCAGVERAIAIVEQALQKFGAPIYVRHEVVHNRFVVDDLKAKGAIFIEDLADVPAGATLIFSAHGVSQAVREEAAARGFKLFDATCPLVTKVHMEVSRLHKQGFDIVMIGHKGHPEVEGTMGQATGGMHLVENVADVAQLKIGVDEATALQGGRARNALLAVADGDTAMKLAYVTQTTLSVDDTQTIVTALKERFPAIVGPKKDDICYATQNRQDAVKAMANRIDVMIVVGSKNSSNSNRLREVAETEGIPAYLVDDAEHISPTWLIGKNVIGVTAGASAPEVLVNGVIARLKTLGAHDVALLDGVVENVTFALPKELA